MSESRATRAMRPAPTSQGKSLQEEALNTQRHQASAHTDAKLRQTPVTFVSAGNMKSNDLVDLDPPVTDQEAAHPSAGEINPMVAPSELDVVQTIDQDEGSEQDDSSVDIVLGSLNKWTCEKPGPALTRTLVAAGLPTPQRPASTLQPPTSTPKAVSFGDAKTKDGKREGPCTLAAIKSVGGATSNCFLSSKSLPLSAVGLASNSRESTIGDPLDGDEVEALFMADVSGSKKPVKTGFASPRLRASSPVSLASNSREPTNGDPLDDDKVEALFMVDVSGSTMPVKTGFASPRLRASSPLSLVDEDKVEALFMVDVSGSKTPIKTGFASPRLRTSSPTSSQSSGDVVIFRGRGGDRRRRSVCSVSSASTVSAGHGVHGVLLTESPPAMNLQPPAASQKRAFAESPARPQASVGSESADATVSDEEQGARQLVDVAAVRPSKRHHRRRHKTKAQGDGGAMADYLENLREHGVDNGDVCAANSHLLIDLGDSDHGPGPERKAPAAPFTTTSARRVHDVLASRCRHIHRGPKDYLVWWEGQTREQAEWTPQSALTMPGAAEKLRSFEIRNGQAMMTQDKDAHEATGAKPREDLFEVDGVESDEAAHGSDSDSDEADRIWDEEDRRQRMVDRMTDEKIARLLSKQEELGMGSAELLIFDDECAFTEGKGRDDADEGYNADEGSPQLHRRMTTRSMAAAARQAKVGGVRGKTSARDAFDVMDRERASVQRAGTQEQPIELSDSELDAKLQTGWSHDRFKKAQRKIQREELRAQGLLGKGAGSSGSNSSPKDWPEDGPTLEEIKMEMKAFLLSSSRHYSFHGMGMDKRCRQLVHELARALNVHSRSHGTGDARHPRLTKGAQSPTGPNMPPAVLVMVETHLASKRWTHFFTQPSPRKKGKKGKKAVAAGAAGAPRGRGQGYQGRGRGRAEGGAYHRDGDIVGYAAPELGVENRGRAMLERMGWSTGTALGPADNKGILHPVTHVVKTSKAGLG
ncbi:MAG: hypothetical protein M1826_006362 [Phylliscum demangeonii]|nr:MAG: hypothetical protein M1826_006362 [Phylliscum demangeonii]